MFGQTLLFQKKYSYYFTTVNQFNLLIIILLSLNYIPLTDTQTD